MPYQDDLRERLGQVQQIGKSANDFAQQVQTVKFENKRAEDSKRQTELQNKATADWQKRQAAAVAKAQAASQAQNVKQAKELTRLIGKQPTGGLVARRPTGRDKNTTGSGKVATGGIMSVAASYKGVPYKWGGNTPQTGLDCSGYTKLVFSKYGVNLPRTSREQRAATAKVKPNQAKPGDLIFFAKNGRVHHVGIYAGGGKMWNSPRAGKTVELTNVWRNSGDVVSYGRVAKTSKQAKLMNVNAYGLAILSKMGQK